MIYGMKRTTVFLPDQLKKRLERTARRRGMSEAELIREGVELVTAPEPRLLLFASGDPTLAERVDEALRGFGED
jgi:hypothetical protein